jgi:vacuolar-type H+-ATPase subunit H
MGNDILHEIIAVETEIQGKIEIEKEKTDELVEKVKRDAEDEIVREEDRLKESGAQALKEALADAEMKASDILEKAIAKAEMLKRFDSESLGEIILERIILILPGGTL